LHDVCIVTMRRIDHQPEDLHWIDSDPGAIEPVGRLDRGQPIAQGQYWVLRAMGVFTELPAVARKQTMGCHAQIKAVIADVQREGFSPDAILWSTLGAITNIYRGLGFLATEIMILLCYRQVVFSFPERIRSRNVAALISARCVKACGKFPRCSPLDPSCSEYSPRWFA
jgi:hypothetical protein